MKKEEVRLEIEAALKKFKESGGIVEVLPDEEENKVFGWEDETVGISARLGIVHIDNTETGFEYLKSLGDFFSFDMH